MNKKLTNWLVLDYNKDQFLNILPSGACYVVYLDGFLSYIGQSSNVRKRFQNYNVRYSYGHGIITPWGIFDDVVVKVRYGREYGDWAMVELKLLKKLCPVFNCVGGKKRRSSV